MAFFNSVSLTHTQGGQFQRRERILGGIGGHAAVRALLDPVLQSSALACVPAAAGDAFSAVPPPCVALVRLVRFPPLMGP